MSTISASTTSTTGFKVTSDTTGTLVFQTGASPTTAMSISSSQIISFTNPPTATGAGSVASNTAFGTSALAANTTGSGNSAFGASALLSNQGGAVLAAFGTEALKANTSGNYNVAFAPYALTSNTTGASNTGVGVEALRSNTTASNNTTVGYQAGYSNTTGYDNTFIGFSAGFTNTTGYYNTFVGDYSGYSHTTGVWNTCIGKNSGYALTTGSKNTIIGGFNGNAGGLDIRTASNYIVLSDGDGNPRYYYGGGHYFTGINSGAGTYAMKWSSATGQITYDTSSARYKDNIRDSVYGLEAVMQIRSVQFEYKDDGRQDVGLIAEEVYEVIPELVALDDDGNPNAVSYDRFVSVCIKAIQELKAEFDAYKATHP